MVVSNSRPVMLFLDSVVPNRNLTLRYFENFRGDCQFPGGKFPPGNMPRINTVFHKSHFVYHVKKSLKMYNPFIVNSFYFFLR